MNRIDLQQLSKAALIDLVLSLQRYRAMWAAKAEANVRTTIATARLQGDGTFSTIPGTLA